MKNTKSSRISGFYKRSVEERIAIIAKLADLSHSQIETIHDGTAFSIDNANHMIENAIGIFGLPLGIATNFSINNQDYLIPLVIEEPSVVAALSNAARLFREGGGFSAFSDEPLMIGQVQVLDVQDLTTATEEILKNKTSLLAEANTTGGSIVKRGGGARDIEVRSFEHTPIGPMLVVHLLFDTRDAMGANAINTAVEHIAPQIEDITGGRVNLRILSNLTDRRKAYAKGRVPAHMLEREDMTGEQAVQAIIEAGVFAEVDPYRATTHNKGIMNGIDAVVIATGNDWRAVEAGAHAFAARRGTYSSLTKWAKDENGDLIGEIELPLAVGTVGGATRVHPMAQIALQILGTQSARELAEVMAAVGLAQNFAAIRALSMEGIQHGHMRMHARQLAVAAGATDKQVAEVARQMITENRIRLERAKEIIADMNTTQEGQ